MVEGSVFFYLKKKSQNGLIHTSGKNRCIYRLANYLQMVSEVVDSYGCKGLIIMKSASLHQNHMPSTPVVAFLCGSKM